MSLGGPVAGAGEPRRRKEQLPKPRRVVYWLVWWTFLMALWVWADDTLLFPELFVGAIAAAVAATLAELAQYQAATHIRLRSEWLALLAPLPRALISDTWTLLVALWRQLASGAAPPSGFTEEPCVHGGDDGVADTKRAVLLGVRSFAPNTVALGIDPERDVLVTHRLVASARGKRG